MKRIFRILVAVALLTVIMALLVTSVGRHPLHGARLMSHMFASGVLVVILPLFAIVWLSPMFDATKRGVSLRIGYWAVLLTGFLTTVTMFLSMLPIAGTDQLQQLILIHGYAGLAMVAAGVLFALGWLLSSRTPLHPSIKSSIDDN
ncbi:hypothetical protein [Allorhodopirellula heiligendammensis]|uniref:DUF4405 domain-containing protein n=1 Tax=Allorhodopirellula heiligendammensis TaxID=2714739 RepID=A0A5C6C5U2_9BACT|nr:hypothetical protein [Allorhodopirellula heiligendammensis]TWU19442.1 hypothetical protein Poly21_16150 [Allorhodopirellula heiligendammensis]